MGLAFSHFNIYINCRCFEKLFRQQLCCEISAICNIFNFPLVLTSHLDMVDPLIGEKRPIAVNALKTSVLVLFLKHPVRKLGY